MQLISFTVKKYRSIKSANINSVEKKCIIIGPNNEGKSNIMQGLALCLSVITGGGYRRRRMPRFRLGNINGYNSFDWERDYPVDLQVNENDGKSSFEIIIKFNNKEKKEFSKLINFIPDKSDCPRFIIEFNKSGGIDIDIKLDKSKSKIKFDAKSLFDFFGKYLSFHYIPAIRPTEYSINIIEGLVESSLGILDSDKNYNTALRSIESFQKPILDSLGKSLTESIKGFIPEVKKVEVAQDEPIRRAISRSVDVFVEDTVRTNIEQKGDGVKSLIAISLVNSSIQTAGRDKSIILALEEPESHLHPAAVRALNKILNEISESQQVIITTHSPLLVDRSIITRNVLVNKQKAEQVTNISTIRDAIGVQVSDNLINSNLVLLVEGESDKRIISKLLSCSTDTKKIINDNQIIIDSLYGGTNFSYKITLFNAMLCDVLFFLDNDECGRNSFSEAESKSLINLRDGFFSNVLGKKNSEIEDMINQDIYFPAIKEYYGIDLDCAKFKSIKKKWSEKVGQIFKSNGKKWDDKTEKEVKTIVADCVVKSDCKEIIIPKLKGPIINLSKLIKERAKTKK